MATPPPRRVNIDQALKRLLESGHDGFLALVAPSVRWVDSVGAELPVTARLADAAWRVQLPNGKPGIFHVELQVRVERDIGGRLADYAIRLWLRERCEIRTLVVYLRPGRTVPKSPFVVDWMGQPSLRYDYDVLKIWEVTFERVLAVDDPAIWPLAGLMRSPLERAHRAELLADTPHGPRPGGFSGYA